MYRTPRHLRSARFGFREAPEAAAPRASVMPDPLPSVDPLFHDAAFRGFEPETPDQAEAFRGKGGRQ